MKRTAAVLILVAACRDAPREAKIESGRGAVAPVLESHTDSAPWPAPRADSVVSQGDSAAVTVCVAQRGDTFVYHYEVANGPRALLRVFDIGMGDDGARVITDNPDGGGELQVEPPNVREADGGQRILPPGAGSPHGWYAEWQRIEESTGHLVAWYADSNQFGILPRETRGGFSISIPGGDSTYATAHWTLHVDAPRHYTGRLRRVACR